MRFGEGTEEMRILMGPIIGPENFQGGYFVNHSEGFALEIRIGRSACEKYSADS
jgi:hypothetical protein